ncbi:hypothetical protein CRP804_gp2 [Roseobacter phage CRP-804]|uniref:Uncharacterized protein n=1 Tax=Roseobacter phage CRP-804 TaxID=3072850 RepID=A0AAX3ZVW9_9CAUD|nr:hypothetical protein CRP804_gp2 [Roseobacter phage CRP-804]
MTLKECRKCKVVKSLDEYPYNRAMKDNKASYCYECHNELVRIYKQNNKEKINDDNRKYREENREKLNAWRRDYYRKNKTKILYQQGQYLLRKRKAQQELEQ